MRTLMRLFLFAAVIGCLAKSGAQGVMVENQGTYLGTVVITDYESGLPVKSAKGTISITINAMSWSLAISPPAGPGLTYSGNIGGSGMYVFGSATGPGGASLVGRALIKGKPGKQSLTSTLQYGSAPYYGYSEIAIKAKKTP